MTDVVRDAIAEELANVERVAPAPAAPFGYGTDLSCGADLTPTMESVDAFSPRAISEALVRRFDTPRGALVDDPDYGIDLKAYCNRASTAAEIRALAEALRGEAEKDDRIVRARVVVSPSPAGTELSVRIVVTPQDARTGTFSATLAVTSAEVLIREIAAA